MNIFVAGYYGFGNLGDELLLLKVLKDISNIVKASFFVWTSDLNYTVNFLEKRYPVTPIYRYDSQATIKAIQNSDLVIFGSGGLIQEYYTIDLSHWFTNFGVGIVSYALPALIGKIFKKPVFYWALGHGPLFTTTGKLFASWFYSLADCITLRDALSFSQVKELQVDPQRIFLDTDPLLDPKDDLSSFLGALPEREDHLLGISLRNWYTTDQLLEALLSSLLRLLATEKDLRLSLIPAHPAEDLEIHRKLFSALPGDRVSLVEERDPLHLAREILRCHWFVGMRLHAVIISARAGIPTLVLSYDQKTNSFAKEYNLSYLEVLPHRFAEIDHALERLLDSNSCKLPTLRDYLTPAIFKNFLTEKEIIKEQREVKSDNLNTNHSLDPSEEEILALENLVHQREYYLRENNRLQYLTKELTAERDRLIEELRDAQEKIKEKELELKQAKQRLNEIYNSNFWKLAKFYYQLRDKSLLRYLHKYYSPILNRLFR
ncbi:MAG: polysaccharide pyruvyl transferase family protein [Desulfurococcaceae archaeon]